jgi:hypothetical protein
MLLLLHVFLLNTFHPFKNILPARTYISNNVQGKYIIDNDVDELMCFNYKSDSFIDFLAYLIRVDVEYIVSDDYFIFRKKPNNE